MTRLLLIALRWVARLFPEPPAQPIVTPTTIVVDPTRDQIRHQPFPHALYMGDRTRRSPNAAHRPRT